MSRRSVKTWAITLVITCCVVSEAASGDQVPDPILELTNIPALPSTSFYHSGRFTSEGLLYLWDGSHVWRQNDVNANGFTQIGTVPDNTADAGPIQFSHDETRMLLGKQRPTLDQPGDARWRH